MGFKLVNHSHGIINRFCRTRNRADHMTARNADCKVGGENSRPLKCTRIDFVAELCVYIVKSADSAYCSNAGHKPLHGVGMAHFECKIAHNGGRKRNF